MADINPNQTLGEVIYEARIGVQRSLRDIAKALTITPSYLSDIENDRRVPSEEVLRNIATLLNLDFDYLMALAGRFGEQADRYMKRHPAAGVLFRRISETNLPDEALQQLLKKAQDLAKRSDEEQ
jgi:transcriptional regulator with XRE-family HTH domain